MSLEDAVRTIVRNEIRVVLEQLREASKQAALPFPETRPEPEARTEPPSWYSRAAVRERLSFLRDLAARPEGITPTEAAPLMQIAVRKMGYNVEIDRNKTYSWLRRLETEGRVIPEPNTDNRRGSVGHGRLPGENVYHAPLKG